MSEYVESHQLLIRQWEGSEELNEELRDYLLVLEATVSGARFTNVGGWHGPGDFVESPGGQVIAKRAVELGNLLRVRLEEQNKPSVTTMWGNVNRKGHYMYPHVHTGRFSGFYCVDPGAPPLAVTRLYAGITTLPWTVDARPPNAAKLLDEYTLVPKAGQMIVFPSSLLHCVEKYEGDGHRITIAFNLE